MNRRDVAETIFLTFMQICDVKQTDTKMVDCAFQASLYMAHDDEGMAIFEVFARKWLSFRNLDPDHVLRRKLAYDTYRFIGKIDEALQ